MNNFFEPVGAVTGSVPVMNSGVAPFGAVAGAVPVSPVNTGSIPVMPAFSAASSASATPANPAIPAFPVPPSAPGGYMGPARSGSGNELTVISKNTVVDGNIRSFADMSIDGDIKGDVETTKDIDLNGKVVGNLTCNNAGLHDSQIQGNLRLKGNVAMERDTVLIGDLTSTYADLNGKIKGNINIAGKAQLKEDAVIFGDISASTITVDDGAIIQGYVSTTFLSKEESKNIFPEQVCIWEI